MILRMWKAHSTVLKMNEYIQHATTKVFPGLNDIEGFQGAYLLKREIDGQIEFVVLTLWESMTAVQRFAGSEPDKAVVEPEAQATLTSFEKSVTHFEVVASPANR
ncbi:MAG TPA: antibiotic biosynthesis monooxygenase [Acidobacteriota bacterium]|nr:antibiotic biosynthesis monooxygenase [Acidobacteriota bacterium]